MATGNSPPPPMPWTARATISWSIVCARPHATDPTANTRIPSCMIRRREWMSESFASTGVATAEASM